MFYAARGSMYQSQGDNDLAIADYDEILRLEPKADYTLYSRGIAYRDKGNLEQAIADLTEALGINPKYSPAYHERGVAYRMKGDREHAIADFREAIRLDPKSSITSRDALDSLGAGEPKTEPEAPKRGVLDLLK